MYANKTVALKKKIPKARFFPLCNKFHGNDFFLLRTSFFVQFLFLKKWQQVSFVIDFFFPFTVYHEVISFNIYMKIQTCGF